MPRARRAPQPSPDSISDAISPQSIKSFESGSISRIASGLSTPNTSVASSRPQRRAKLNRPSYAEDDVKTGRSTRSGRPAPKSSPGAGRKGQRAQRRLRNATSDSEYDYGSPLRSPVTGHQFVPEVVLQPGMSLADMYCDDTDEEQEQIALLSKRSMRGLSAMQDAERQGSSSRSKLPQPLSDIKEEEGGFVRSSPQRRSRGMVNPSSGSSSRKRPRAVKHEPSPSPLTDVSPDPIDTLAADIGHDDEVWPDAEDVQSDSEFEDYRPARRSRAKLESESDTGLDTSDDEDVADTTGAGGAAMPGGEEQRWETAKQRAARLRSEAHRRRLKKAQRSQYAKTSDALAVHHQHLKGLWKRLSKTPKPEPTRAQQPDGLTIKLLPFQLEGLYWLRQQELGHWKGGILADEMGMGKTIQMISLFLSDRQKPILVVLPTVAIMQWKHEIAKYTEDFKVMIWHGATRESDAEEIRQNDVVLTSYGILESAYRKEHAGFRRKGEVYKEKSALHAVRWHRVVLDEAHNIKERATNTAKAAFALRGTYRWCLSGTPLQNRVGELYSMVRFLGSDIATDTQKKAAEGRQMAELDASATAVDSTDAGVDTPQHMQESGYAQELEHKFNAENDEWLPEGTTRSRKGKQKLHESVNEAVTLDVTPDNTARILAMYYCKSCPCTSLHWQFSDRRTCDKCGHSPMRHINLWNQEILKPIQRTGAAAGEGGHAFKRLRLLLSRMMLRRTKLERADDMGLPPRTIVVRRDMFNEEEEDLYASLYTEGTRKFSTYLDQGTVLNNYSNIFTLLTRMRQMACHPDLVLRSKAGIQNKLLGDDINESIWFCRICTEEAEDAIMSKCRHIFCRDCVTSYYEAAVAEGQTPDCPHCHNNLTIDLEADALEPPERVDAHARGRQGILERLDMSKWRSSSKIEALLEELERLKSEDKTIKSIVFSQFVNFLDLIGYRLQRAGYRICRLEGGMTPAARDATIRYFMENAGVSVFLVSLKAGGVALNLTEASRVFLMDPWWNPSVEVQAMDRIHRLGQYRPIKVTRLVIENSIESRIIQLQDKKGAMIEAAIGSDDTAMTRLTVSDLQFLFSL